MRLSRAVQGHGPAMLLVAGTGFPGATWPAEVVETLATEFTVVTFDHRGTGTSPASDGDYETRTFAADAAELVRDLGLGPAHVVGHSMGGRVAQWMALDASDTVATLILAASGPGQFRADPPQGRHVPQSTRDGLGARGYRQYIAAHIRDTFFTPEFAATHPERVERLVAAFWEQRPSLDEYLKHVAARQRHQTTELLERINVPTLVIVGDRDTHQGGTGSHWDQSRYLAAHVPGAELRVIAGASHGLFWERPDETIAQIRDWLARVSSARRLSPSTAASSSGGRRRSAPASPPPSRRRR